MEDINCWQEKFIPCQYSEKLLNKLNLLNSKAYYPVDINEIIKAIYYAKKYHGNQMRDSGEPYYSHPIEVAYMLSDYLFRTNVIVSAILHDCIEDTALTKDMIACIFSYHVAELVDNVTRIKISGKISSAEMVKILYREKKYDALMIKVFDRLHNTLTVDYKPPEKIKKIIEETLVNFITLSIYLQIPKIEHLLVELSAKHMTKPSVDQESFWDHDNFLLPSLTLQSKILHIHKLLP